MSLPAAPPTYSKEDQDRLRALLDRRETQVRKIGDDISLSSDRLILKSPNGTQYALTVSDDGELSAEEA